MAAITLGLACAIASLTMVVARFCMIAILFIYVFNLDRLISDFPKIGFKQIINKERLKYFGITFLSLILILILFYPPNIFSFLNTEFIFTHIEESKLIGEKGFFANIFHNIKFFAHYFVLGQDPDFSSNLIV